LVEYGAHDRYRVLVGLGVRDVDEEPSGSLLDRDRILDTDR
jgi:hypothetical protein